MAETYENLDANLQKLKDGDAIPQETEVGHLSDHVKKAIDELNPSDIATLTRLATSANAHLFVHDKKNHVVAMGL